MLRIGMLGSDNEHAARYTELLNLPDHPHFLAHTDARVVALWGQEQLQTQAIAQENQIDTMVDDPTAMLGLVDAVICVAGHGVSHLDLVRPYLQARVPTFVDEPLAIDSDDARTIVALAAQNRTPFSSFSPTRFCTSAQNFFQQTRQLGDIQGGHYSGPARLSTGCGAIIFSAISSIELLLMTHGVGIQWVHALAGSAGPGRDHGTIVALCAWANGTVVTLDLPADTLSEQHATAWGNQGIHAMTLDRTDCYRTSMQQILAVLKGNPSPVPPTAMIEAIQIGAAIDISLAETRRVYLYEV
ncbi:MAG: Gfo/Idh/MocA family oxidoreductase [Caldilineaceae bacterium]|nr:Gfo/Idh/MocA family oxidoreductase [Caldilineaceae bacterium]